jgi:hypothetical protein
LKLARCLCKAKEEDICNAEVLQGGMTHNFNVTEVAREENNLYLPCLNYVAAEIRHGLFSPDRDQAAGFANGLHHKGITNSFMLDTF